jgi:hypothetical protein
LKSAAHLSFAVAIMVGHILCSWPCPSFYGPLISDVWRRLNDHTLHRCPPILSCVIFIIQDIMPMCHQHKCHVIAISSQNVSHPWFYNLAHNVSCKYSNVLVSCNSLHLMPCFVYKILLMSKHLIF